VDKFLLALFVSITSFSFNLVEVNVSSLGIRYGNSMFCLHALDIDMTGDTCMETSLINKTLFKIAHMVEGQLTSDALTLVITCSIPTLMKGWAAVALLHIVLGIGMVMIPMQQGFDDSLPADLTVQLDSGKAEGSVLVCNLSETEAYTYRSFFQEMSCA